MVTGQLNFSCCQEENDGRASATRHTEDKQSQQGEGIFSESQQPRVSRGSKGEEWAESLPFTWLQPKGCCCCVTFDPDLM